MTVFKCSLTMYTIENIQEFFKYCNCVSIIDIGEKHTVTSLLQGMEHAYPLSMVSMSTSRVFPLENMRVIIIPAIFQTVYRWSCSEGKVDGCFVIFTCLRKR